MDQQAKNTIEVAAYLKTQSKIVKLHFLGNINEKSKKYKVYKKQYSSSGALIAFEIKGGEKEAFTFLNNLKLIKLAVSLGSTESLAQHPATMTHAGVSSETKEAIGINERLVRISIGIENHKDLINDIKEALSKI